MQGPTSTAEELTQPAVITQLATTIGVAALVALVLLLPRLDYLSHLVVGFGLTVGRVLTLVRTGAKAVVAALVGAAAVTVLGVLGELWWFGGLFFDWIDVSFGAMGAVLAAASLWQADQGQLGTRSHWFFAVALVIGGLMLRYVGLGNWP